MKKALLIIPTVICFTFFTTSSQTYTFCKQGSKAHCAPAASGNGFLCLIDGSDIKDCRGYYSKPANKLEFN